MPSKYKPVSEKSIPWAALHKVIKEAGAQGIALYDLAAHFEVKTDSRSFRVGMDTLRGMDLVSESVGQSASGMIARVVQLKGDIKDDQSPRQAQ